jgi:methylglyoxal/glyoxal reductase
MEYFKINNKIKIPSIGIGPGMIQYRRRFPDFGNVFLKKLIRAFYFRIFVKFIIERQYISSVSHALKSGYRLIDSSAAYGNEKLIGKAIKKSKIKREELYITTRVSNIQQFKGNIREELIRSMKELGVGYIDLYMFHWPVTDCFLSTWEQMVQLQNEGLVKVLGVANCHKHHIEALWASSGVIPSINQIEVHPLFTQKPLLEYCKSNGILIEAYTPIARNDDRLTRNRILEDIGKKYNKTIQQVILRWHTQNGIIPITRSHNRKRQIENISIFDFKLSQEEIYNIDSININSRLRYDPDNCDFTRL